MHVIVLAAMIEEADAVVARLRATADEATSWPRLHRAMVGDHRVTLAATGIGKASMSGAAATLHARDAADLMMAVGTAGKIAPLSGDCFWLARAVQHDYGRRTSSGFVHYDPGAIPFGPAVTNPFSAMDDPGTDLPHATITSGDSFVEDAAFASHLARTLDATLVDMETAALAQTASLLGVRWAGIKATTDDAGGDSINDFHANLRRAADRAAEALARFFALL